VLAVAAAAWTVTAWQAREMSGMAMGLGSPAAFGLGWTAMAAAMMLPTAVPLVVDFARRTEGRRGWVPATLLLAASYLAVWIAFGALCYLGYRALEMPWPDQASAGGAALGLAGVYALTPFKRRSQERCRELCDLHGPLPFDLLRAAVVVGARYGLSCLGCTGALMLALVLVGMSNLGWMVLVAGLVLVYKLAPPPSPRQELLLSVGMIALGIGTALTG
jgi:predicted metal-binding membrane protein